MLKYLVPIISFLGIYLGVLLKKIAKEEVKFGKFGPKYFVWMKRIILFLIIIIILTFADEFGWLVFGVIVGLILGFLLTEYLFLGIVLVISFLDRSLLLITSSLVFLYGLPYGSILRKIRAKHMGPVATLFFLPYLLLTFEVNLSFLIGVSVGGLFQYIIRK